MQLMFSPFFIFTLHVKVRAKNTREGLDPGADSGAEQVKFTEDKDELSGSKAAKGLNQESVQNKQYPMGHRQKSNDQASSRKNSIKMLNGNKENSRN